MTICSLDSKRTAAAVVLFSRSQRPSCIVKTWALKFTVHSWQGSFSVRKTTGTLRIWRALEREPIWGSGGGAPSGVQGQSPWSGGQGGEAPLKLKAFYYRREQVCHSHLLNFAAICRKGPERRSGDQKKNRNGVPVRSGSKRTLQVTRFRMLHPM